MLREYATSCIGTCLSILSLEASDHLGYERSHVESRLLQVQSYLSWAKLPGGQIASATGPSSAVSCQHADCGTSSGLAVGSDSPNARAVVAFIRVDWMIGSRHAAEVWA